MGLASLLASNPALFVFLAGLLLYSVIFHEIAHGWVAYLFGDDTAMRYGSLTLNPAPHIDPVGVLMLFLVGFGWAKPVPVDYDQLRDKRWALFCVSLAGCATNILIAMVAIILLQFDAVRANNVFSSVLPILAKINIILGAFNLIPIPPLDGSKILMSLLPQDAAESLGQLEPYGFFILVFLLFTGLLNPVITFMQELIYGLIAVLLSFFKI